MGQVVDAVRADLDEIGRRDRKLADSALAATALAMARELDSSNNSATSKSMCSRVLLEALEQLRNLAPAPEEADKLDDLASRRAARLARVANT